MASTGNLFHAPRSCPPAASLPVPRRPKPEDRDPLAVQFGAALRATRNAQGRSLEDVAYLVPRLDPRYLGEIELGFHSPTVPTALRIAHALDVGIGELVRDVIIPDL